MTSANASPLHVILADDHTIVRRGLAALLQLEGGFTVVAEARNGEEALDLVEESKVDVVILDLSMPRLNGVETTRRLQHRHPTIKVLVLSMYDDEEFVIQALQAGASGYVLKQSMEDELFQALEAITAGEIFVSPTIPQAVVDAHLSGRKSIASDLTPREREILQLIADGNTAPDIADLLCISPHTVNRHRANLMQKLGVHNQAELIRLAIERGLVIIDKPPHTPHRTPPEEA